MSALGHVRTLNRLRPFRKQLRGARQNHPDFRKLARLRIDFDRAAMLLDDNVVTDGEPKPGALSGRFRREEWIEHLLLHVRQNTGTVVADSDFDVVTQVLSRGNESGLVVVSLRIRFTLHRRVKAI